MSCFLVYLGWSCPPSMYSCQNLIYPSWLAVARTVPSGDRAPSLTRCQDTKWRQSIQEHWGEHYRNDHHDTKWRQSTQDIGLNITGIESRSVFPLEINRRSFLFEFLRNSLYIQLHRSTGLQTNFSTSGIGATNFLSWRHLHDI